MNRVSYNMGRIAFFAGEPFDPGSDEFFVSYVMKNKADEPELLSKEGTEWKTGWMAAKKEASEFFAKSPNPPGVESGENE